MSQQFHFYDPNTGMLHSKTVVTNLANGENFARANAPHGHVPIAGRYHHMQHRVDIATGKVVEYQPEAPSDAHEWDAAAKIWRLNTQAREARAARSDALQQITTLEVSQSRALRELALSPDSVQAKARVKAIDEQIAKLRTKL